MGFLSSFLHPERGYKDALNQLQNYYNQANQAVSPYNQNAQESYGRLNEQINNLMNPDELRNKWMQSYSESPQAQQAESLAKEHGLSSLGAMGLMGSSAGLNAIQKGTSDIALQDRENYVNNMLKQYMDAAGLGQGVYNTGANAANTMSQNAMNMGNNAAQMQYGATNAPGDMFSKLLQGGVSAFTPVAQAWGMNKLGLNNGWSTTGGH